MNEDLSKIIEKTMEYAKPLPVTSSDIAQAPETPEELVDLTGIGGSEYTSAQTDIQSFDVEFTGTELGYADDPNPLVTVIAGNENLAGSENVLQRESPENHDFLSTDSFQENLSFDSTVITSETEGTFVHTKPFHSYKGDTNITCTDTVQNVSDVEKPRIGETPQIEQPKVKRKRRREKNPDPPPAPVLPPCCICDDKSSGFHYGANTCEACKGFFRRTLKKKEVNFNCKCVPEEKEAWKRGPLKNGCPACRYERCLAMGMSKNAIKIGRYTLDHKTDNIKQVKSIEAFDSLIEAAVAQVVAESSPVLAESSPAYASDSSSMNISSTSSLQAADAYMGRSDEASTSYKNLTEESAGSLDSPPNEKKLKMTKSPKLDLKTLKEMDSIVKVLTEAHTTLCCDEITKIPLETIKQKQTEYLTFKQKQTEYLVSSVLLPSVEPVKQKLTEYLVSVLLLPGDIQAETDEVSATLSGKLNPWYGCIAVYDAFIKMRSHRPMLTAHRHLSELPVAVWHGCWGLDWMKCAMEKYRLKKELFGNMAIVSKEEFAEFYKVTGMDLDGRIKHMDNAFKFFEEKIALIVAFAKAIPGFKSLSLDDQASLIKASRTESRLLSSYKIMLRNVDEERGVITTPWGEQLHHEELGKIIPKHLLYKRFRYAQKIGKLNLTTQEVSVLRALLVMSPDRCDLHDPVKVSKLQETLVLCLQHLLNLRPGGSGNLLYNIINLVTGLRELTNMEAEATRKMFIDCPMLAPNSYRLLKEFIS